MEIFGIEITKREILASITIIGVMVILGILINNKINESAEEKSYTYNNALKINEDTELFQYGMKTSVGNALVYGKLTYVDGVSYEDVKGKYMFIKRVTEEYTRHTRVVSSEETTRTEVYYTWDEIDSELKASNQIQFCSVKFKRSELDLYRYIHLRKITIVKVSSDIRYVYYGYVGSVGTLFCNLKNNKLNNITYYESNTIDETLDAAESKTWENVLFWICWSLVIALLVYGFCTLENKWLD